MTALPQKPGFSGAILGTLYPASLFSKLPEWNCSAAADFLLQWPRRDSESLVQNSTLRLLCLEIHQNREKKYGKLFKFFKLPIWTDTSWQWGGLMHQDMLELLIFPIGFSSTFPTPWRDHKNTKLREWFFYMGTF